MFRARSPLLFVCLLILIPFTVYAVDPDLLGEARLSPKNATGRTNLYSQNFSWGTSLVSLPGRSGLDMGIGISYNSLVWTKVGNTMVFNPDAGTMFPGFRFGFPVIEPVFTNVAKILG